MELDIDPEERRIAACLKVCRSIPTSMLELPGARCIPILGIKEGDRAGLCLLVERSAYDALVERAEEGARLRRVLEQIAEMTENARGGSLGMRVHDLVTDAALDTVGAPEGTPK